MKTKTADIVEIFSSIQGEGVFLGVKQIFVRFKDCNLNCCFCDEPRDVPAKKYSVENLIDEIKFLDKTHGPHHSISFTGGEPLLYAEFLVEVLGPLKKIPLRSYLETNVTLADELLKVVDLIDIIAMDFKLPSSTKEKEFWKSHLEFLKLASKKKVFVKAVVTHETACSDIEKAVSLVNSVDKNIPLILQPAAPVKSIGRSKNNGAIMGIINAALQNRLGDIRIIPQAHKRLGFK